MQARGSEMDRARPGFFGSTITTTAYPTAHTQVFFLMLNNAFNQFSF